jgi:hypothetical protein
MPLETIRRAREVRAETRRLIEQARQARETAAIIACVPARFDPWDTPPRDPLRPLPDADRPGQPQSGGERRELPRRMLGPYGAAGRREVEARLMRPAPDRRLGRNNQIFDPATAVTDPLVEREPVPNDQDLGSLADHRLGHHQLPREAGEAPGERRVLTNGDDRRRA